MSSAMTPALTPAPSQPETDTAGYAGLRNP